LLHRLNVAFLCLLAWACLLLAASPAQAIVVRVRSGQRIGVTVPAGRSLPAGATPVAARAMRTTSGGCDRTTDSGTLNYQCGSVVHSSRPYLIFWDPSNQISATSKQLMARYMTDTATPGTAASDVFGVVRQYFDATGYAGESQSFSAASQMIVDTQPYPIASSPCSVSSPYTACVLDSQVQAELTRLIAADNLPVGGVSTNAPIYFVVLPQNTNECLDDGSACAAGGFCAYHGSFANGPSTTLYAVVPFAPFNFGPKGCQSDGTPNYQSPNHDQADQVIDNLSHEYSETVTDPGGGTGWMSSTGMEVGDLCQAYGPTVDPANGYDPNAYLPALGGSASDGTLYDQLIHGEQYYTQSEWSNGENDCKTEPGTSGAAESATFAAPTPVVPGAVVSFDPSGSAAAAGLSNITFDFGDGSTAISTGTVAPVQHAYAQGGTYTVTMSVVDLRGNVQQATHQLVVGEPPTAVFTAPSTTIVSRPVSFDASGSSEPNGAARIAGYAWSFGDGTTGTGVRSQHAYAHAGTYTVTLAVTDSLGFTSAPVTRTVAVAAIAPGRITGTRTRTQGRSHQLLVSVSRPGRVSVGKRSVTLGSPGTARFRLVLSRAQLRRLKAHHAIRLHLKIVYTPDVGQTLKLARTITLR
jgi:hypothetical protein